jgi:hypothetical protein
LDEIERFAPTYLTDYDSVRAHSKRGCEQLTDGNSAAAANVRRLRLELNDVR